MMTINHAGVREQIKRLTADFGTLQAKQAPFAIKWAAEASVTDASDRVRLRMKQTFNAGPRGMRWIQNHVRALREGDRWGREYGGSGGAALAIIPPGGALAAGPERYRGSLIAMFERGGPTPGPKRFGGAGQSGMSDLGRFPIPIRTPGTPQPYSKAMYPVNLGLSSRTGISGRRAVGGAMRGKRRTYLVPIVNAPGHSMIFQRYGKERDATQPIFWVQRQTRVPARPFFFATAEQAIGQRFGVHFPAALQHALFGRGRYVG